MDPPSPNNGEEGPEAEAEAKISKCFHLYNCDTTYKFDSVEKLLESIKEKLDFDISIAQQYFHLREMSETCERINSEPQMDFAIFVVHAHECRLSINEDKAGLGYAKIYRALLQKTSGNVIIVIGGDDNYKNSTEEQTAVISRWVYRKVSSQFDEQFLDGRKSFIFSWDKEYRPIHEEAMLHFFDPNKKGKKFVPEPKVEPTVPEEDPQKGVESYESEQRMDYQRDPKQMDGTAADNTESVGLPQEKQKSQKDDDFVMVSADGVATFFFSEDDPAQVSLKQANTAILYRDQSDIVYMRDLFGDDLLDKGAVTIQNPSDLKEFFSSNSVGSCFMFVEAKTMQEELQKSSNATPYEDLLRAVREKVEEKVVIFLCYNKFSQIEADAITVRIKKLLVDNNVKILCKQNAEDPTLLLKTRLRHGKISYDEKDVEKRVKGWTAPQRMADELLARWQSTINAELQISQNTKTGDHHIVVKDGENNAVNTIKGTWQSITSSPSSRPRLTLFGSGNTSSPKDGPDQ